jgi:hypothetical protein
LRARSCSLQGNIFDFGPPKAKMRSFFPLIPPDHPISL